jgi:acetyl esterase
VKFGKTTLIFLLSFSAQVYAQVNLVSGPQQYIYTQRDSINLKAYIFSPEQQYLKESRPAIVIFHGGGWFIGEPSWAFGRAQHFAKLGFIAIAAQYRLSNQKDITPLEAMADSREVIKWMRLNADSLHIDPDKIVAYGWSAGAHLAASAAIFNDTLSTVNSIPNALVLVSPAVSLTNDSWVKRLLLNRAEVNSVSPDENVREGLPPTIILQGRDDTVTPLAGVQQFTTRMLAAGNRCELIIYDGVGHLFTPSNIPDYNEPQPDPRVQADAFEKTDEFLKSLGYIE